ncbi:phospholipase C, phosphocholine-specific [Halothiobacillus diazotrophicus]|uniref:phospholipase C n=1 Tax=Halothiobacillus diazotrophicus TaxID=1860122 RepID=A0A191ZHQ8_9GAMM|nr:phospholipase C, phosphocholine-specific [Halothiobacillus diazotrophicus]ANJ67400.1 phospholipase C, phosphocholine-specific [Halothiobacillus diazotrophicus]
MPIDNRRDFLRALAGTVGAAAAVSVLPPAIRNALAIEANHRTGTIKDVEHIVVLMQENRAFDHYFGTMAGVRGFGDRFPIPLPDTQNVQGKSVWYQTNDADPAHPQVIPPFHLNTVQTFDYMRVTGTPHTWLDAQAAWNNGKMNTWPTYKHNHAMGYFTAEDIPFQYALANAFTLCDAYHSSFQGGTNTNRLFHWTGTNDPLGKGHGPATYNNYDHFDGDPGKNGGYTWTTYPERLEKAGISWQIYENMADNFTDNPLAGFKVFRDAWFEKPGYSKSLKARGVSTRDLDKLKEDVLADKLPQVSWIIATADGSEHPDASSPAQGADYTAHVLEALTANPDVWSKTVFIVNFDENDGFFDHVPPPSAPAYTHYDADPKKAAFAGASTVDTTGEYHEIILPYQTNPLEPLALHRTYGLGPRVPLYVISPWSKGGWVNSQVFDHTSVIRFIEERFGVKEPNISPWRRAVCGDLTSTLDFKDPDNTAFFKAFPDTVEQAKRARALTKKTTPETPTTLSLPVQATGTRPARALPYALHTSAKTHGADRIELTFGNTGSAAAVFHVYDRKHLDQVPRRYTVEAHKTLTGSWDLAADGGAYDLWVLGPNGYHRHFTGHATQSSVEIQVQYDVPGEMVVLVMTNHGQEAADYHVAANAYFDQGPWTGTVVPNSIVERRWPLQASSHWYDFTLTLPQHPGYSRRFAGHLETGKPSISDPALGGKAIGEQVKIV